MRDASVAGHEKARRQGPGFFRCVKPMPSCRRRHRYPVQAPPESTAEARRRRHLRHDPARALQPVPERPAPCARVRSLRYSMYSTFSAGSSPRLKLGRRCERSPKRRRPAARSGRERCGQKRLQTTAIRKMLHFANINSASNFRPERWRARIGSLGRSDSSAQGKISRRRIPARRTVTLALLRTPKPAGRVTAAWNRRRDWALSGSREIYAGNGGRLWFELWLRRRAMQS